MIVRLLHYTFLKLLILGMTTMIEGRFSCRETSVAMCRCTENKVALQRIVDCSHAGLTSIPLDIPAETTHLYLDQNNLEYLNKTSFSKQNRGLKVLSLNHNKVRKLEVGVFKNLPSLEVLTLYNNSLEFSTSLPKNVFLPLKNLKVLDVRMNLLNEDLLLVKYPVSVSELTNVIELRMDILRDKPLPTECRAMMSLQRLIFSGGRPNAVSIKDDTFDALAELSIQEIHLVGLNIGRIGKKTFSKLSRLRLLDLSNNPRLNANIAIIAPSLRLTSLSTLRLNNTGLGIDGYPLNVILQDFCSTDLKELTLDHNRLHDFEPFLTTCFPRLEILSLSRNYIMSYTILRSDIFKLKYLVGLNVSFQTPVVSDVIHNDYQFSRKILTSTRGGHLCETGMACPFVLPKSLQWIDVSHNGIQAINVPELVLFGNYSLKYFKGSFCGVQSAPNPLYCPRNIKIKVETVDLSNNNLQCVNASFFDTNLTGCDWSSLRYLLLGSNKLGMTATNICNQNNSNILGFLEPLKHLKHLDLSNNKLMSFERLNSLQFLTQLEILDLSTNGLENFTLNLINMTNLHKLNLANNNIQQLSRSTVSQLTKLKLENRSRGLEIDLSGNVLSCKCQCYDFLKWMEKRDATFLNSYAYECKFDDGRIMTMNRLPNILSQLESRCFAATWLTICIGVTSVIYFIIIIFSIMYRIRHDIWYLYMKMKLNRQKLKSLVDPKRYTYNAFISCDHRDAKYFVKRRLLPILETPQTNLKFCVAQRDFIVGATIIDNIMRFMNSSKKIVFIISEYFLESKWCKEEIRIAQQVPRCT